MKYSALVCSTWRAGWMQWLQAFSLATRENYFLLHIQAHTLTYNWLCCCLFLPLFFLPSTPSTSNAKLLATLYCGVQLKLENKKIVVLIVGVELHTAVSNSLQSCGFEMVLASMFPCKILLYFNTRVGKKQHGAWVKLPDVWTCSEAR